MIAQIEINQFEQLIDANLLPVRSRGPLSFAITANLNTSFAEVSNGVVARTGVYGPTDATPLQFSLNTGSRVAELLATLGFGA